MTKVQATKDVIDMLMKEGRTSDAAFTSNNPLHTKLGENYFFDLRIGNVTLDFNEQQECERYCIKKHRFDPKSERIEWSKKNRDRIFGNFSRSSLG